MPFDMTDNHTEDRVEEAPVKAAAPTPAQQAKVEESTVLVVGDKRFVGTQQQAEDYARQTGQPLRSGTKASLVEQGLNVDEMNTVQQLRQ